MKFFSSFIVLCTLCAVTLFSFLRTFASDLKFESMDFKPSCEELPSLSPLPKISQNQRYRRAGNRWIFVITATHRRPTQRLDLIRFFNSLAHVEKLHLILVEDSKTKTRKVSDLFKTGLMDHWSHSNVLSTPGLKVQF